MIMHGREMNFERLPRADRIKIDHMLTKHKLEKSGVILDAKCELVARKESFI